MRIFVTGAAGLIGGEVASRLAARGHRVSALVHRNPEVLANDGGRPELHNILHGDVTRPGLGLDPSIAGELDLMIHCAATTRFDLSDADYRATNVAGVANAIEFTRAGGMAFLHVSTAYVCGQRDGIVREDDPLPATGFANGYEASKAAGEALVAASGLTWAIARPSVVVGASDSGAIRTFDTIYAAFKLIAEGRVRHMAATADATIDFVPIDHVAASIVGARRGHDGRGGRPLSPCLRAAGAGRDLRRRDRRLSAIQRADAGPARTVRSGRAAAAGTPPLCARCRALQQLFSARPPLR